MSDARPPASPKVLLIDDSPTVRLEIEGILSANGFAVSLAGDGREGLWQLWRERPDVILCDIVMPGIDGYEVLKAVRENPQWSTIPLICLTARTERVDMRRAMELGADDYVTKPVTARELVSATKATLEKRALIEQQNSERMGELRRSISLALPHEFRTPLGMVVGYSKLIKEVADQRLDEELCDLTMNLLEAAQRLSRLTENFLLHAQLEISSREDGRRGPLDVDDPTALHVVVEAVARARAEAANRSRDLACELEPVAVFLREDVLEKLASELVDNAFKSSDAGSPVRIRLDASANYATLTVTDRGSGMDAKHVDGLAPHQQSDHAVHEQEGMGLGLGIVQRVAELAGGTLSIESRLDEGTTITLRLPTVHRVGSTSTPRPSRV